MAWKDRPRRTSERAVSGDALRAEAVALAEHGWPVIPGTFPQGPGWTGRPDAAQTGPIPVPEDWAARASTDPERVRTWWAGLPYSILVPTGLTVDVVEVPASVGRRTAAALRDGGAVPIATAPTGEWLFPVRAGEPLRPDLAGRGGVALQGRGGWFAAPPTTYPHGPAYWRVHPSSCGWALPDPYRVQDAVAAAVRARPGFGPGMFGTHRVAGAATGTRS